VNCNLYRWHSHLNLNQPSEDQVDLQPIRPANASDEKVQHKTEKIKKKKIKNYVTSEY